MAKEIIVDVDNDRLLDWLDEQEGHKLYSQLSKGASLKGASLKEIIPRAMWTRFIIITKEG